MKIDIPDYSVPFLQPNGLINPVWYEKLKLLFEKRNIADLVGVDAAGIADGEVLVWVAANDQFEPGAN